MKKVKTVYPPQSEIMDAFTKDKSSPDYKAAWQHYSDVLNRAYAEGRMATPERMRALYPTLREIAEEVDELI